MSRKGSYIGGHSVKSTMTGQKAAYLNKRAIEHAKKVTDQSKTNNKILDRFVPEQKLIKKED